MAVVRGTDPLPDRAPENAVAAGNTLDSLAVRRSGRRPGHADTRADILVAARGEFAGKGFAGATMRGIAGVAGVDPALVHHYFGSKRELFLATVELPIDPAMVAEGVASGDPEQVGARLVGALIAAWDSPAQAPLLAVARSVMSDPANARMLQEFVFLEIVGRIFRRLGLPPDEIERRAPLVISQILGLILGRYLLQFPGLVDAPAPFLVATIGPTLQRYITGELPQ